MSAAAAAMEGRGESYRESLTERMSRAPLPLEEALRYAIQIATSLRDLHRCGLVYGAVSSQSILLGPAGASPRSSGGLARLGDRHPDVAGFAAVLEEMRRRVVGPEGLREKLAALAMRCQEGADMQKVLIALRLLALEERLSAAAPPRMELAPRPKMAGEWAPLANIAAFAMWGK
jgi:serine/threonine protein kinase